MLRTEPALLMADKLRAVDIKKLKLAVLSACGTANTDQGLAGPGNLVRAFLSAGVPHVVASKWRVDSQVTSELMTDFYSGLVSGKSVPEALRIAEARVRSHPETAHPYYWAAFASFGS
jgi:CHAT domain-containing protein